jgi:hypothetical protein
MVFSRIIFGFLFQRKINNLIRREFKQWWTCMYHKITTHSSVQWYKTILQMFY